MALNNFTPITKTNTMADLTNSHNEIGNELTKPRNIFVKLDEMEIKVNNSQLKNITTESGLSKTPIGDKLLDVKEVGVYFYSASNLATKGDKPNMNSQDVVLVNTPTNNSLNLVQQIFPITTSENGIQQAYRVVTGNIAGDWVYLKGNVNSRTLEITEQNLDEFMAVGEYFVSNCTGMPENEEEGLLKVYTNSRNYVVQELISVRTLSKYHRVIGIYESNEWVKQLEPSSISKYTLGGIHEEGYTTFGITLYKEDNIGFKDAVRDHIVKTGQPTFTFYVQGGVEGNPNGGGACRGIFVSDTSRLGNEVQSLHGVYYAISTTGNLVTGSVSGGDWRIPKGVDTSNILWSGTKEFTSKKAETMKYSADDFDYFKVYVTIGGNGGNSIYRQGFEFGKHSANKYKVSGVNVPSSGTTLEHYMCSISFKGNKFTIDEYNTKTNGTCYVTEIVGINRPI